MTELRPEIAAEGGQAFPGLHRGYQSILFDVGEYTIMILVLDV
jgi:hypothetical protein